jgi:thermostable 8-oxoguanine DNA glycosylase
VETIYSKGSIRTLLDNTDREILGRIVRCFGQFVEVEPLAQYRTMTPDDVWLVLVGQVCVMGSAGHMERLQSDDAMREKFKDAVSLQVVGLQHNPVSYLEETLRNFSVTRFPNRSAERLVSVLQSLGVFQGSELVLFEGLSHNSGAVQTRDEIIERCPAFRLKSASDFLISVGLSHDVIALDTRVVGIMQKYLGYNLTPERIQSHRGVYLSLEAALREFCREQNISLALLDRLLFRFSNLGAIELAVKHPELIRSDL